MHMAWHAEVDWYGYQVLILAQVAISKSTPNQRYFYLVVLVSRNRKLPSFCCSFNQRIRMRRCEEVIVLQMVNDGTSRQVDSFTVLHLIKSTINDEGVNDRVFHSSFVLFRGSEQESLDTGHWTHSPTSTGRGERVVACDGANSTGRSIHR